MLYSTFPIVGRHWNRRGFLRQALGGIGALSLPNILRLRAEAATRPAPDDTSLILLWQDGGPSHFETFDPKPDAPAEYRGELRAIPTTLPGVHFCEILPRLARMAHQFTVIRSLHQASSHHVSGTHTFITGYYDTGQDPFSGPPPYPDLGAVIHRMRSGQEGRLPNYVALDKGLSRGGTAYLGRAYGPFAVDNDNDPSRPNFKVKNLQLQEGISAPRFRERMDLLGALDSMRREIDSAAQSGQMQDMDRFHQRAYNLLNSPAASRAFDFQREEPRLRERYGLHVAGQQALLARRLVEAGVSVVAVRFSPDGRGDGDRSGAGWDDHAVHGNIFQIMKRRGPQFDQAVSALIEDLGNRGLDRRVLVVVAGEFGRTPKISYANTELLPTVYGPGRDHWGAAGCALVYGGGLRMGQVIGATNRRGEYPVQRPLKPQDLLATIYQHMGIDTRHEFLNFAGRPIPILPYGEPIRELTG